MVAPFLGCAFGGFLYDFFIYTGPETPLNEPWLGTKQVFRIGRRSKQVTQEHEEAVENKV
jgi:aquaglyceroporin related protein, other eukaryote